MDITGQEYKQMNKQAAPRSPVLKNCVLAFLVGGLICAVGQVVVELETGCLLYTSPSPRDRTRSRMQSSA